MKGTMIRIMMVALMASVLAIATDARAAIVIDPIPTGWVGCNLDDAECSVDGHDGFCNLEGDLCKASSVNFVELGYPNIGCDNPQVKTACAVYFGLPPEELQQGCLEEDHFDPITGEKTEHYLHVDCLAEDLDQGMCEVLAQQPMYASSAFFDGKCGYPNLCGDGRWGLKEVCDPTAETTGCKGNDFCIACEECASECSDGAECLALDECGFGTCKGLVSKENRCEYRLSSLASCEIIDMLQNTYLGGEQVCSVLYGVKDADAPMLQECYVDKETGYLTLACEHNLVMAPFCLELDDLIIDAKLQAGSNTSDDPDRCKYVIDPGDTGANCGEPEFMGEVCDRIFKEGESLQFCRVKTYENCSFVKDWDECLANVGCTMAEFPIQPDPMYCFRESGNTVEGCAAEPVSKYCKWNESISQCISRSELRCTEACTRIKNEPTCLASADHYYCRWEESDVVDPEFCAQFDYEGSCLSSLGGNGLCRWINYSECVPVTSGECLPQELYEIECVAKNEKSSYSLPSQMCQLPYEVIIDTAFEEASSTAGTCECAMVDTDQDGLPDFAMLGLEADNCPIVYNPKQEDYNLDGVGNACDCKADGLCWAAMHCESMLTPDPDCDGCLGDNDEDGVCDVYRDEFGNKVQFDNCLGRPNTDQKDADGDDKGDRCDCDGGDLTPDGEPLCTAEKYCFFQASGGDPSFEFADPDCCNDFDYNPETGEFEGDGWCLAEDCAPKNPEINPGMLDNNCDGIDNNCSCVMGVNGVIIDPELCVDEGYESFQCGGCEEPLDPLEALASVGTGDCGPLCISDSKCVDGVESCEPLPPTKFYRDDDKDSFGVDFDSVQSCDYVPGYVVAQIDPNGMPLFDCEDWEARVYPGAPDTCGYKDGEMVVVDRGCGDGFDDINCDEVCVDKDDDLFAGEKPADWIDGCGIMYTAKKEACSWLCPWIQGIGDCNDNDPNVFPGAPGEEWGLGIDNDCDGIYCGAKTDYEHGLDCVGTPVVVTNMEELAAYMEDYGWTGAKYSGLRIAGDLEAKHIDIHSPCKIDIVRDVTFKGMMEESLMAAFIDMVKDSVINTAQAAKIMPPPPSPPVLGPTLCIDGMAGVQHDKVPYVIEKFDKVGVLSGMGDAVVANVEGNEVFIASGNRTSIAKNSKVTSGDQVRLFSIGEKATADVSIEEGAIIEAKNRVVVRGTRNASIGAGTTIQTDFLRLLSEGKEPDSKVEIGQKANIKVNRLEMVSYGGIGDVIQQFAKVDASQQLHVDCVDNVDGCKIHKKAIFGKTEKRTGNCMEDLFCPGGPETCNGDCLDDMLASIEKAKCLSTYDTKISSLWTIRYDAEMACWNSYDGDLKAADKCAAEAADAFKAAQQIAADERLDCAMPIANEGTLCYDACEAGCQVSSCIEGLEACMGECKPAFKACANACSNYAECGEPCYDAYRARNDICDANYEPNSEEWTQCIWDSIIDYRKCDTPCQRENTMCVIPCDSENVLCQSACQIRCDAFAY